MITRPGLRCLLASALASSLMLQASISYADDTEIFFGGSTIDTSIQPNVLFVLDNSGSMADPVDRTVKNAPSKMSQLKSSFETIINSAGKINVGVMSMNTNPRLLSPVQDINKSLNVNKLTTPAIVASGDDATYNSGTAATVIADPTLVMGKVKNADNAGTATTSVVRSLGSGSLYDSNNASYYVLRSGSTDYVCSAKIADAGTRCLGARTVMNGHTTNAAATVNTAAAGAGNDGILLFRNLNIPKGVTIQTARLILTPAPNPGTATTAATAPAMNIRLENTKTAAAFNSDTALTTAQHDFSVTALRTITPASTAVSGGEVSFDIKTALTALTAIAPASNPLADVAVRVRGNTAANFYWYIGNGAANSPRLEVTWTGNEDVTRTTGLRFQNVAIPKGATIISARIDFVPAASDDRDVKFLVSAQNASDAGIFTTSENFTTRTKVATTMEWSPPAWKTEAPQVALEGPIVTDLVQDVINNSANWCGNNSMAFFFTPSTGTGTRTAFSVDAGNNLQPVLNVKYSGGDTGCLNPILNISLVDPKDDANQGAVGDDAVLTTKPIPFTNGFIGARFQQLPVLRNATVMDAQLIVNPNNTTAGTATVAFENVDNSTAFTAARNDISSRSLTTGAATCAFTPVTAGVPLNCTDVAIKTQLQSIFNRSGWADGNSLSVILKPTSSTNFALKARDTSADVGLKLRVKLQWGGLGNDSYTVRDLTNGVVQALNASGGTPIVPTLLDAAKYFVQTPDKHSNTNASPITSSCQANFVVFLTDGEANGNPSPGDVATFTGQSCMDDTTYAQEKCARTLVEWLATTDQATYEGINTIKTSTIGFGLDGNAQAQNLLKDLARVGAGKVYAASNASDLTNAFEDIVQSALATNTTFVNTSAPVNSFNRADNLDQLYFALFRPAVSDRWAGNLKRYRLKTENGVATIVDADDVAAIDTNTGFFKSSARSFWNDTQDGNDIAQGGAAHKLKAPASRSLYTYTGTIPSGTPTALESLVASNNNITKARLGDASMDDASRVNLISYIRGGPDANGTTAREALGDPIHSSPRLVTYGCNTYTNGVCTSEDLSAIMGSNEGYIHSFNTNTGVEQFAYMPVELLPNIKQLRDNSKSTSIKPRLYGMDNTVSLWVNDANGNGVIYGDPSTGATTGLNDDEFVYAYATMGRGGRNIYALDITDRSNPKLLWEIKGGVTTGFEKLGQTWSVPHKTKIKIGTTITDVLIFGGGYDTDQDSLNQSNSVITADDIGNAVYIVNAKTGALIWSASSASGHTATLSRMNYSIPSSVRVIDIQESNGVLVADADRLADQFFVGDMGGQVWRFYINNGSTGSGLVTPGGTSANGLFATVGGTTAANARRFYNEPDVSLLNVNGNRSLAVSIGSGYRGHPLNNYIRDRFYAFRTATLFKTTGETTLTESSLYDATQNLIQTGSDSEKQAAKNAFNATTGGWFLTLGTTGEKVLSRSLTAGGVLYWNTYEPTPSSSACSASVGKNRYYAVRLMDGTPASVDANGNGTPADRWVTSNSGGIAGDPQLFCEGDQCHVIKDPSVDIPPVDTPPLGKTYWIDQSNLD